MTWGNAWGTRSWGGGVRVIDAVVTTHTASVGTIIGSGAVQSPGYVIEIGGVSTTFVVPAAASGVGTVNGASTRIDAATGTGAVQGTTVIPRLSIVVTNLTTLGSGSDAAFYDTPSVAPAANALILVTVTNTGAQTVPTLSGCGMTWVSVTSSNPGAFARYSMFRGMSASPSTGPLRADFGGVSQTGCCIVVDQLANVDQSGSQGSGAVAQSSGVSENNNSGGSVVPFVNMGAFSSSADGTYFSAVNVETLFGGVGSPSPGAGMTTVATTSCSPPAQSVITEWSAVNVSSPEAFFSSGSGASLQSGVEVVPLTTVSADTLPTCIAATGSAARADIVPFPFATSGTGAVLAPSVPLVANPDAALGFGAVAQPTVVGADLTLISTTVIGSGVVASPDRIVVEFSTVIVGTGAVQVPTALAIIPRLTGDVLGLSDGATAQLFTSIAVAAWTADITQGARISTAAFGLLSVPAPVAPFPSPENWQAVAAADATAGATTITVVPIGVNMPTGAIVFFPSATVILTQAANPGDTVLHVRPVSGYVTSGHSGSGGAPAPSAPGIGQPPAAPHWGAWDGFRPLRRTSLRYPKPVLDADGHPT